MVFTRTSKIRHLPVGSKPARSWFIKQIFLFLFFFIKQIVLVLFTLDIFFLHNLIIMERLNTNLIYQYLQLYSIWRLRSQIKILSIAIAISTKRTFMRVLCITTMACTCTTMAIYEIQYYLKRISRLTRHKWNIIEPAYEILVPIIWAISEGSDESVHPRRIVRAIATRIHKVLK